MPATVAHRRSKRGSAHPRGERRALPGRELRRGRASLTGSAARSCHAAGAPADLDRARAEAENAATDSYKAAAALGPLAGYAQDLHQLSRLVPGLGTRPGGESAAHDLTRMEQAERSAYTAYQAAQDALQAAAA